MKTISENVLSSLAVVISAWVVFASYYLYYVTPERPWPYLLAISVVCFAWIARCLDHGDGRADPTSRAARRKLTQAIVFSGLLLGVALGVALIARLGWMDGFSGELGERSRGFIMGAIAVAFANAIPKQVSSARGLAMLRVAGWAMVLGGVGYAMAWLLLPLSYANVAAMLMMLSGLTYAAVRIAWYCVKHRSIPPPPSR